MAASSAHTSTTGVTSEPLTLVLASNNAKKLFELQQLLQGLHLRLLAQSSLGIGEAEEPHISFVENALAKARHAAAGSGGAAIADDSGLCVDALAGAPGVISAHYAGLLSAPPTLGREELRRSQDAANNQHLLHQMQGVAERRARFVCTLVAIRHAQDPEPLVAVGRWEGELLAAPQGEQGFGYDPLLWLPDLGLTVAQMDSSLKNQHSHRARAAAQMRELMQAHWRV